VFGLVPPALSRALNAGRMSVSMNNCRQIMIGFATYRFEQKDQVPMRGHRYAAGQITDGWDTFVFGGKNCDKWWHTGAGGAFDESAFGRPLNAQLYPQVAIEAPP